MPTWDEVKGYMRGKYRLVCDEPHWLGMEWHFGLDGETATQRLKIERISAFGRPWMLLLCAIAAEDNVDARGALRYNALPAIGTLACENGRCYLRAALPLDGLTWPDLDRAIEFLATEATKLRGRKADDGGVASLFSGMAE